jgi:hypothetical protein
MKNQLACLVMTLLVLVALPQKLSAQDRVLQNPPVDLGEFTKEIMIMDFRDSQDNIAMWLPFEFFVAATLSEGKNDKGGCGARSRLFETLYNDGRSKQH